MTHQEKEGKACPFVERTCLRQSCMAWDDPGGCKLISPEKYAASSFDARLRQAAPLMYGSLLDLVSVMEVRARECEVCGPDLWDYAQEVRRSFLDDLIEAQLKVGVKAEEER
ncbi:MAG TPA: hypothetical protein HA349_07875 [Methanotrichaceae archaeon]|nr:hypothetical protein [Methanotrichaceae archaeon]